MNPVLHCLIAVVSGIAAVGLAAVLFIPSAHFCANSKSCIANVNTMSATAENGKPAFFQGETFIPPAVDLAENTVTSKVLGAETSEGEKHIYVDLSTQTLYAFQGKTLIMNTLVSTGKWNPTPPGDYKVWVKLRSTRMSGGEGADAYDLPNVPFVLFFYNDKVPKGDGYSLHGAYWHDNFGHMMSHGCVNMRSVDAEASYNWADPVTEKPTTYATPDNPGTTVSICTEIQNIDSGTPVCAQ
ncbi:hypothetical protein BH10PAT2_BH10PAT2_3840 [soil metagenome]